MFPRSAQNFSLYFKYFQLPKILASFQIHCYFQGKMTTSSENMQIMNGVEVPPFRNFHEFLLETDRYEVGLNCYYIYF